MLLLEHHKQKQINLYTNFLKFCFLKYCTNKNLRADLIGKENVKFVILWENMMWGILGPHVVTISQTTTSCPHNKSDYTNALL